MRTKAKAMFHIPRVTMKGGRRKRVIRKPLNAEKVTLLKNPQSHCEERVDSIVNRHARHNDGGERHQHSIGKIYAASDDDKGLSYGEDADHHDLLDYERKIAPGKKSFMLKGKEYTRQDERDKWD